MTADMKREEVLKAVTSGGYALQFASEGLQDDKEVVIAAVTSYGLALEYASEGLRADKERDRKGRKGRDKDVLKDLCVYYTR